MPVLTLRRPRQCVVLPSLPHGDFETQLADVVAHEYHVSVIMRYAHAHVRVHRVLRSGRTT